MKRPQAQDHVALSVVGTERLLASGFFRAKMAQENLIKGSSIPYSIVRATQFFEFVKGIADFSTDGNKVRLPLALIQPMAADDVAGAVGRVATGSPVNGTVEVGGPEQFRLDELIRQCVSRLSPRTLGLVGDLGSLFGGRLPHPSQPSSESVSRLQDNAGLAAPGRREVSLRD
jgi:uncharacterized protein YbjT (DUF2867 family)